MNLQINDAPLCICVYCHSAFETLAIWIEISQPKKTKQTKTTLKLRHSTTKYSVKQTKTNSSFCRIFSNVPNIVLRQVFKNSAEVALSVMKVCITQITVSKLKKLKKSKAVFMPQHFYYASFYLTKMKS